jgi:hypothetical protein
MQSTVAGAAARSVVAPSFLERWAPAAGTLFAALFVAAFVISVAGLDTGDKLPEITQSFASKDYRSTGGFVFILILLSALCFLWFLADLTAKTRSLSQGMLASLVPVGGAVFITMLVAAAAVFISPLLIVGHSALEGGDPKTVATMYVLLGETALGLFGLAGIAGALMMSAAATIGYRGALVPRWGLVLVVIGAVIAAIASWMFVLPILLVVVWVLVASVRSQLSSTGSRKEERCTSGSDSAPLRT